MRMHFEQGDDMLMDYDYDDMPRFAHENLYEDIKWEWRVFWPNTSSSPTLSPIACVAHEAPIAKNTEENSDTYILIPSNTINLKFRKNAISVKPMYTRAGMINGYKPKKTFSFPIEADILKPIIGINFTEKITSSDEFLNTVLREEPDTKVINIKKIRENTKFIRPNKLNDGFKEMKAEFSTLMIDNREFNTFCLESRHRKWLKEMLSKINIKNGRVMDYVDFLSLLVRKGI